MGNKWYNHLEESPELKAAYQAIWEGHGVHNKSFARSGVDDLWKSAQIVKIKTRTEYMDKEQLSKAIFRPIEVVVKKEGNSRAAVEGIIFFIKRCIQLGCVDTYIKRHEWTNRVIVAIPNKSLSQAQGSRDEMTKRHRIQGSGSSGVSTKAGEAEAASAAAAAPKGLGKYQG